MKKMMILLSMLTICMSCAKEMNPAGNEEQPSSDTGKREFVATMENVGTKTALDAGLNVKWSKGDAISVFDETGQNFKFETQDTGLSVVFSQVTEGEMVGSTFYAIFPYREDNKLNTESGEISSTMNTANYNAGPGNLSKAWHNIMTAKTENNELHFKNLASLVKFTIPEGLDLKAFYFGTSAGMLASAINVAVGEDGTPSLSSINDADGNSTGKTGITLNPSNADIFEPGVYYMPILPGTYKNFRILMTWASGDVTKSDAFGLSEFKAERNKVVNIGTLYDNREYYKWMNFENGKFDWASSLQDNVSYTVVDNEFKDDINGSSKILKSDASLRTTIAHGGFNIDISAIIGTVRERIKSVKFQMYVSEGDDNKYYPVLNLGTEQSPEYIKPSTINGVGPAGTAWEQGEFNTAFKAGQWNTFVYPFGATDVTTIKIRPMSYYKASTPVSAETGSRIIYLDNIGFSYIGE